jgi:hypothetical protein
MSSLSSALHKATLIDLGASEVSVNWSGWTTMNTYDWLAFCASIKRSRSLLSFSVWGTGASHEGLVMLSDAIIANSSIKTVVSCSCVGTPRCQGMLNRALGISKMNRKMLAFQGGIQGTSATSVFLGRDGNGAICFGVLDFM